MKRTLFLCLISVLVVIFESSCDTGKRITPQTIEKPIISLMVWDEKSKEGSDGAELQLFQVGTPQSDLTVKFTIGGTAKNGYDFRIRDIIKMRNPQASLIIKPIDDLLLEGDETVIITLIPDPAYAVDPENNCATVLIQDNELPDAQFLYPCSGGPESFPGSIELTLSGAVSEDVKIDYTVSGILAQNSSKDYKLPSGSLIIPAGSTEITLPINIIDDNIAEDDETLIFEIVNASNANIGLNEKHYYTIINDDGDVPRSSIYDKIYGIILGSRGGSSLGAVVEGVDRMEDIEKLYGIFNEFLSCNHYDVYWSHPAGGTEDGIKRQKCIATA